MNIVANYDQFDLIEAPIFVLEISPDGEPVYAAFNSYARRNAGRPLSDYLGRTAVDVYPHAFGRTAYERHCEVRDTATPTTYQLDLPIGGTIRGIRTTLRPECDSNGKVVRLFGSSIDMTSERHAVEAKVQFDTLSSEMEQFVALAAHDLRAPMRNIAVIADLLRDEPLDGDCDSRIELLDTLDNIAVKSMDLITDVLLHVETVASERRESVFSLPALCHDILETLDPDAKHTLTAATATLSADRTAMQIALRNMTENAMKHGGRDNLHIRVDVQNGLPGLLDITLMDNGQGFSSDALKVMNEGKFRAESGYGLFAVKRLISARGGNLVARNLPDNEGAVVRFSLPGTYIHGGTGLSEIAQARARGLLPQSEAHRFSA